MRCRIMWAYDIGLKCLPIYFYIFPFSKQAFNESLEFCNRSQSHERQNIKLTFSKLTWPCNSLQTSNSFARSDTGVVIDSEPHLSCTCKTNFLFAPLAVVITLAVPLFYRFALQQNR